MMMVDISLQWKPLQLKKDINFYLIINLTLIKTIFKIPLTNLIHPWIKMKASKYL